MNNNPTAIVMGATSGIGYEVARLLALRGWKVGVAGRREDILSKMTTGIEGVVAYELIDVTTPQAIEGLHRLIGKMGQMDLYFHSSGIGFQNITHVGHKARIRKDSVDRRKQFPYAT